MPKATFFNLPPEKQTHIIDIALEEFNTYGYDKASVSRIVKNAEIATGSFYQYFINLEDVLLYIINEFVKIKLEYFKKEHHSLTEQDLKNITFREYLGKNSIITLKLKMHYPAMFALWDRVYEISDKSLIEKIYSSANIDESVQHFTNLFSDIYERAILSQEIRPDLSLDTVMLLLINIGKAMEVDFKTQGIVFADMTSKDLENLNDLILDIFMNAISFKK